MSVKREVGVYIFVKEFCFRVRVRVDTNPNPKTAFFNKKIYPNPAFYWQPWGLTLRHTATIELNAGNRLQCVLKCWESYAFHLTLCLFGSFLILLVFAFRAVWSSLIVYRSCIFALCVIQVSMFRPREGYGLRCDIEPQTAIFLSPEKDVLSHLNYFPIPGEANLTKTL